MADNAGYAALIARIKHSLIDAAADANEPLGPLMIVADLAIDVLSDAYDGDPKKFQGVIELFYRRLENNIDAAIAAKIGKAN
jgi:hypothetical protein